MDVKESGSPPRMRGKPFPRRSFSVHTRITPAHAGKTLFLLSPFSVLSDHPRACGENGAINHRDGIGVGSPPRMRGKLTSPVSRTGASRITPAHAGKTSEPL